MRNRGLTPEQIRQFDRDGYLILKNHIDREAVDLLLRIARADQKLAEAAYSRQNYEGEKGLDTRMSLRTDLGEDIYSAWAHSRRIAEPLEQLLRDEVCHFYYKVMLKDPDTGGWEWHQDYGYAYGQTFPYPDMCSSLIAMDPATRENGCLKVLKGSNRLGRLEHRKFGTQLIADPERLQILRQHLKDLEEVYCELDPGDVLYFHGNTLHASEPNTSSYSRWCLILSYTAAHNMPFDPQRAMYAVEKWSDDKVREIGQRHWEEVEAQQVK